MHACTTAVSRTLHNQTMRSAKPDLGMAVTTNSRHLPRHHTAPATKSQPKTKSFELQQNFIELFFDLCVFLGVFEKSNKKLFFEFGIRNLNLIVEFEYDQLNLIVPYCHVIIKKVHLIFDFFLQHFVCCRLKQLVHLFDELSGVWPTSRLRLGALAMQREQFAARVVVDKCRWHRRSNAMLDKSRNGKCRRRCATRGAKRNGASRHFEDDHAERPNVARQRLIRL